MPPARTCTHRSQTHYHTHTRADMDTKTAVALAPSAVDVRGYTLVVPACGLGNICQLAIDCLLNTAALTAQPCTYMGILGGEHVQPIAGSCPFSAPLPGCEQVCLNGQAWAFPAAKVVILQQRAPAKPQQHDWMVQEIMDWAAAHGIVRVLVISGMDACMRPDSLMETSTRLVYVTSGGTRDVDDRAASTGVKDITATVTPASPQLPTGLDAPDIDEAALARWPSWRPVSMPAVLQTMDVFSNFQGCGYAPAYYRRAVSDVVLDAARPHVTMLLMFAKEGDNLADACIMSAIVARYVGLSLASAPGGAAPGETKKKASSKKARVAGRARARVVPLTPSLLSGVGGVKATDEEGALTLPPYFDHLFGPEPDLSTGMYGF